MGDTEILLRIALAVERLSEELCKPLPRARRPAQLSTATYSEEDRQRTALKAQLEAKESAKRNSSSNGRRS